jgi:excisionase family DNA binding protein
LTNFENLRNLEFMNEAAKSRSMLSPRSMLSVDVGEPLICGTEAAARLGVHAKTIYRWLRNGTIVAKRVTATSDWHFQPEQVREFAYKRACNPLAQSRKERFARKRAALVSEAFAKLKTREAAQ